MNDLTRRDLLKAAPLAGSVATPQTARASRPNIIIIISDQFRADNLGCMGMNPMGLTPNLDAMARRGVLFRSAIANHPVCAPARATIFTGNYEERHGVWKNGFGLARDSVTLASVARQHGYSTNYIGKWHLVGDDDTPAGPGLVPRDSRGGFVDLFEGANALERTSHAYDGTIWDTAGNPIQFSGEYRDDFLTDRSVDFIKKRAKEPFLLTVSLLNPHHQNDIDAFVPPREFAGKFKNPFVPQDLRPLLGTWGSQLADYYGCVAQIDRAVGKILDTVKEQGIDKNTIVVFLSDHGCHFKTRNSEYKRSPHESSIRVPLIIQGPGFDRGMEIQELVSQVDLAPSLLETAGLAPPPMQGKSFMPLLDRHTDGWTNEVYSHMSEFMTGRILRTPRWTYAVAAPKRAGWIAVADSNQYVEYMLYDLAADPFQHTNLAGRTETAAVSIQLRERLLARIAEAGGNRPTIEQAWFPYC